MRLTATMAPTIVMITLAIAETMVLMILPMAETTEPCETSLVEPRDYRIFWWNIITMITVVMWGEV